MKKYISILIMSAGFIVAQTPFTWQWSGRVHSELNWRTIETEHFRVHYHQGIDSIAVSGASIAELVYPTLLTQMELDTVPTIDIVFTDEDEIMNGFAMWFNTTFIWVDQNDVAVWLEDEKWLYQVLSHELQHIVYFNTVKSWVPEPWGNVFSGTPGWFVEGLAEFMTEKWRPHRADLSHKWHILKNKTEFMDPHHDGYSKLKYWADRFGDSTIVKTMKHRNKFKMFNFKKGFKDATGISVNQFNEDWRRHMNTYYYGYRAQKEPIEDIGKTMTLPISKVNGFSFALDSTKIAIAGRNNTDQYDQSLFIVQRDTTAERETLEEREKEHPLSDFFTNLFKSKSDTTDTTKEEKDPVIWKTSEVDYGRFHQVMSWSPDYKQLVYAKYHFGENQSMVWDLCVMESESEKPVWLTQSMRASHPNWSPDGEKIVFVAHKNNTSNLYVILPMGGDAKPLTQFTGDVQLLNPSWSPDGSKIAYAKAGPEGNLDIYTLGYPIGKEIRITDNPEVDYLPVWHPDGKSITFTSHKGSTPNLHTVDLETLESIQNTDVGDAVWSAQWMPKDSTILATTLTDVDSVRIVKVDPKRVVTITEPLVMQDTYTRWRSTEPTHLLPKYDPAVVINYTAPAKYKFWEHPKHIMSLVLPDETGIFGLTSWSDPIGRHIVQASGWYDWNDNESAWSVSYVNAQHGPLWGVMMQHNYSWDLRSYGSGYQWLFESLDGATLFTQVPFNFGKNMSSAHSGFASIALRHRNASIVKEKDETIELPKPENGNEGLMTLGYQWINRRPYKVNAGIPRKGFGIQTNLDIATDKLYGEFNWQRLTLDAFANIEAGPAILFIRGKAEILEGANPPDQEFVGLTNANTFYLPGTAGTAGFTENLNPRGWDGIRLGNRVSMNTVELRLPLISNLPVNLLFFSLGSISAAVFSDVANSWTTGEGIQAWVVTAGYELKLGLHIGESPLFIFSGGQAQTIDEWMDEKPPHDYLRLALINPF